VANVAAVRGSLGAFCPRLNPAKSRNMSVPVGQNSAEWEIMRKNGQRDIQAAKF
jgi:hypothetical protein